MQWNIGDKIEGECPACSKLDLWRITDIYDDEYSDGTFRTFRMVREKGHMTGIVQTLKDVERATIGYRKV